MTCICKIHPCRLMDLKYSQIVLTDSVTSVEVCRYLISKRDQLFCSPLNQPKKIGILLPPEEHLGDQNLFHQLTKLGFISAITKDWIFTRVANLEDIRQCLTFTLATRLAVHWNPVGKWFVQRNFMDIDDPTVPFQAVKFSVRVPECCDRLEVWAWGAELKLFPITPQHLNLKSDELCYFMEDPRAVIKFASSLQHRFYYLPKVTTGTLKSISRFFPESSPFKNFADLRNYWHQQYGYILPENSNGIVYFNVSFTNDGTNYTYPSCCVFFRPPEILTSSTTTSTSIIRQFYQDFEPFLKRFPGKLVTETWLINPLVRIPWQQKIVADIEHDVKAKGLLTQQERADTFSKYFLRTHVDNFNKKQENDSTDKRLAKKIKSSNSQQKVNSKITKYFSAQNPNVKIRRTNSKVIFDLTSSGKARNSK